MGTTADKLAKLAETKEAIRVAINDKGVEVSTSDPFSVYPAKIGEISGSTTEIVNLTLTADSNASALIGATITVTALNTIKTFTWEGSMITFKMVAEQEYTISVKASSMFIKPPIVTYTSIAGNSRTVILSLTVIQKSTIRINENVSDPNSMITGDINGTHIQLIRQNSHRYYGKPIADGIVAICQLDDSNSNYFADGRQITKSTDSEHGDIYMKLPRFYYKCDQFADGIWDISFTYADVGESDEWICWEGKDLIGVVPSTISSNFYNGESYNALPYTRLTSKRYSGSKVLLEVNTWKESVSNNGTGFGMVNYSHYKIMQLLFWAQYGVTNIADTLGYASISDSTVFDFGATLDIGMTDTNAATSTQTLNNFWGLESWWSDGSLEIIDNAYSNKEMGVTINDNGRMVTFPISETGNKYVSKMSFGDYADVIPTEFEGSTSTYYRLKFSIPSLLGRSVYYLCKHKLQGNTLFLKSDITETECRLAYKGELVEYQDSSDFIKLKNIHNPK